MVDVPGAGNPAFCCTGRGDEQRKDTKCLLSHNERDVVLYCLTQVAQICGSLFRSVVRTSLFTEALYK
ncbi:hypothetical protein WAI453_010955 [Rhynchosporium graminicola]